MNLQKQSYYSVSSSRAPIRNTADYSPFGVQLDGRTLSYVPPAPAPPSVTVVYQHKFDDNPSTHPYTTAPNQLNTKLTNVSWTNSQSSWTNFAGFTGKAIASNSATQDTTRLYLNLTVNSGFMLDVKSYSFYHRSSTTGYTNYQLLVNGVLVGSGSIFVSSGSTLQSTGTINVASAVAGLTGSVTVTMKLFGGSNGNNATFRLDDFTLNGYTQEVQVYAESYRYGFQNQEKDDELKGAGNSMNFEFRMHDPRVGRFFAIDPLAAKYPYYSTYAFSGNRVIDSKEIEGLEPENIHYYNMVKQKNGNHKAVYHHSSSNLIIKSANTFFKNSITKKQTDVSSGNYGPQENMTNVYTYWNSDGTIEKQVFVSKEITKTRVGYAYENNGVNKVGLFETSTFDNDGLLQSSATFSSVTAQIAFVDPSKGIGVETSASLFSETVNVQVGDKGLNTSVSEKIDLFNVGTNAKFYSFNAAGGDFGAKAAVVSGELESKFELPFVKGSYKVSGCAVCAEIGATSVVDIDSKNKTVNIAIGGEIGLLLGLGGDVNLEIKYGKKDK